MLNYQLSYNMSYSKQTSIFLLSAPSTATTNQKHKLSWTSSWHLLESQSHIISARLQRFTMHLPM